MAYRSGLTEHELAALDIPAMLAGIGADRRVNAEGAVAAAMALGGLGAYPRPLELLAELVRRGGIAYTLGVPELMPAAEQTALVRAWLEAARPPADAAPALVFARDEAAARWLEAVAVILQARRAVAG
jgi:hypothetical protein